MIYKKGAKYDEAVSLYNKGMSIGEIAAFYQVTRQAMWKILKRRGVMCRSNLRYGQKNHFYRGTKASKRVHRILGLAMEKKLLVRPELCQVCGGRGNSKGIQAHHCDYNKPLEVIWLCQPCHHDWHKKNRAVLLKIELPRMDQKEIASMGGLVSAKKKRERLGLS